MVAISAHTEVHVRTSRFGDFLKLNALQRRIALEAKHMAVSTTDSRERVVTVFLKAVIRRNRVYSIVAENGDDLVGYVTLIVGKYKKVRQTIYIVMGVDAQFRGQGIGTELLKRAEEFARSRNAHRLELEVFSSNRGAIGLYERLGFIHEGRKREAVKTVTGYDDILLMGKIL